MSERVSIIIPVFNTAGSLPKCLDSCLNQTFSDLEIVVVIDGSADNSAAIALEYASRDKRIKVIEKENEGLPLTRRRGFDESTGDYIFHLDSDDYLEHNAIGSLAEAIRREDAGIVIGGTLYERKDGSRVTEWISETGGEGKCSYLKGIFSSAIQPNIWGRLIRREIFEPVRVPAEYNCGEDYLANIMMICYNTDIKIVTLPDLLYHYVVYGESLTNTWPAEVFMPYTDKIASILKEQGLEDLVMEDWAWFRVVKSWRYYLRRGGKKYLKDREFLNNFYTRYYSFIKHRLSLTERLELELYRHNQRIGHIFSRAYLKILKLK